MRLLVPILLLACALPAHAEPTRTAQAVPTVSVPADASVEREQITLGQIATFHDVAPALQEQLSALPLGAAAPAARQRVLGGKMLREAIQRVDPSLHADVPERVRVHRAYRDVPPETVQERLEAAIRHRMRWPAEAVELTDWTLPSAFAVPAHHDRLRVHFHPGEDFLGRVSAELEFFDADAPEAAPVRRSASAELIVRLPVVVAAQKLRRGTILTSEHLRSEETDLRRVPRSAITDPGLVLGARLARGLPEGTPLLRTHLESEPLVKRGDVVRVQAAGGALDVSIEARALDKGGLGERIRFENPQTRARFDAEVTGPGTARMSGGGMPSVGAH